MSKYLIEVPHQANTAACVRAVRIFLNTGSHFLSHADWGCLDGVHKAWIIVDVENKEQARSILPPAYRPQALIVKLNEFRMEQIDEIASTHTG
jgi:hypothetical protein